MIQCLSAIVLLSISGGVLFAQESSESLQLFRLPLREDMNLVVTAMSSNGRKAAFATERGDLWILEQAFSKSEKFSDFGWRKFAFGLHQPSAVEFSDGDSVYVRQSVETTLVTDTDKDGIADRYFAASDEKVPLRNFESAFQGFIWLDGPKENKPFAGQYFGGSQSGAFLSRLSVVDNEKGKHSSLFVFQRGLVYPVECMTRLDEKAWLIAQSNRSDPNRTRTKFAVQRGEWLAEDPFEVESIVALDNGFKISFTKKLLQETAEATWSYRIHSLQDSEESIEITSVKLSDDSRSVTLECSPPVAGKVYQISADGNWSKERDPVKNPSALFQFYP